MGLFEWLRRYRMTRPDSLRESQKETLKHLESLFGKAKVLHALIGGVAMSVHGAVRGTKDIDYLVDGDSEVHVHAIFESLGFETLQRTPDVSSYLLGQLRLDVVYARRPYSKAMLANAERAKIDNVEILTVRPEDIIGLKLQALMHQPERVQDRADIITLLRLHGATMDRSRVREYARVLDMEAVLDELERQK
jgi:hypothetical protein